MISMVIWDGSEALSRIACCLEEIIQSLFLFRVFCAGFEFKIQKHPHWYPKWLIPAKKVLNPRNLPLGHYDGP